MLHLRKLVLSLAVLVTFALGSLQAAHADKFNFTFASSDGYDVMGTLFATSNGDGSYTANTGNITIPTNPTGLQMGTFDLLPTGSVGNDNLLFPGGNPLVNPLTGGTGGLSFGNGVYEVDLYASSGSYFLSDSNYYGVSGDLTLTPAAVPELSTVLGFGSFVILGGVALLRQRKQVRKAA